MVLWASTRRGGRSLPDIVKQEISPFIGLVAAIAIILILVVALAGLGIAFVNALADSVWGAFTDRHDHSARHVHGLVDVCVAQGQDHRSHHHRRDRPAAGGVSAASRSAIPIRGSASFFHLSRTQIVIALGVYGFAASMLPVWLLLSPRGYLSSFTKIGTIFLLALGVIIVNPEFQMPALTRVRRAAAARSFRARCSRSASSPSRAAPSPASTR